MATDQQVAGQVISAAPEGGSILVPMLILAAGYTILTWGWVLVKGWDITLLQWVNPFNPYQWPPKGSDPPPVSQGRVWPAGKR